MSVFGHIRYSMDLRERAISRIEAGESVRMVAAALGTAWRAAGLIVTCTGGNQHHEHRLVRNPAGDKIAGPGWLSLPELAFKCRFCSIYTAATYGRTSLRCR